MNGNPQNAPDMDDPENTSSSGIGAGHETPSNKKVEEIIASVDMTKKPQSRQETIMILDDDEMDASVNQKTEGDIKKDNEKKAAGNVNDFRSQLAGAPPVDNKFNPDLSKQQAEAWVKIIDMGIRFVLKAWSGQADNTGLEPNEKDKDVLAQQIAIALNEYKFVVPILVTVFTTAAAMYATPIMNARDSKKKIDEFRAEQKAKQAKEAVKDIKMKPEFNPATGKHIKKKGGQYKL